jgi:SET domain-containing protein
MGRLDRAVVAKKPLYAVRRSGIHGRGVFARHAIRKGTVIVEYKGRRRTWNETREQTDSVPEDPAHTFLFELNDGRVIDAGTRGNAARWINHSCDPNCRTFEDDGRVFIEAKRRILADEELCYEYRLIPDGRLNKKELAQYACRCGARKCRGTMLDKRG